MKFTSWFRIDPPGSFGVPEGGRTVVPPGELIGPTILTSSMVEVGHGTLSQYRAPEDAVNVALSFGTTAARFQDNFLMLENESEDYEAARTEAQETANRLVKHIALDQGRSLRAELIAAEDEQGNRMRILRSAELVSATTYDLDGMRAAIGQAGRSLPINDERLERALP